MTDKTNDILVDYEGLSGQLCDLVEVIDIALIHDDKKTAIATLNVIRHSLNHLIAHHTANAERQYQPQEVAHERA